MQKKQQQLQNTAIQNKPLTFLSTTNENVNKESYLKPATAEALYPLRSLATSVLIHFGPFYKDRTDKGPKWQRTEVDKDRTKKLHVIQLLSVTQR